MFFLCFPGITSFPNFRLLNFPTNGFYYIECNQELSNIYIYDLTRNRSFFYISSTTGSVIAALTKLSRHRKHFRPSYSHQNAYDSGLWEPLWIIVKPKTCSTVPRPQNPSSSAHLGEKGHSPVSPFLSVAAEILCWFPNSSTSARTHTGSRTNATRWDPSWHMTVSFSDGHGVQRTGHVRKGNNGRWTITW